MATWPLLLRKRVLGSYSWHKRCPEIYGMNIALIRWATAIHNVTFINSKKKKKNNNNNKNPHAWCTNAKIRHICATPLDNSGVYGNAPEEKSDWPVNGPNTFHRATPGTASTGVLA
eukprot:741029-Amphidinium_carterae.1